MPTNRPSSPTDTITNAPSRTSVTPGGRTAAENKLLAALCAHPAGATAAQLASAADIGRSTATKIIARWASDAFVARTAPAAPDAGTTTTGRPPERWSLPQPDSATDPAATTPADVKAVDTALVDTAPVDTAPVDDTISATPRSAAAPPALPELPPARAKPGTETAPDRVGASDDTAQGAINDTHTDTHTDALHDTSAATIDLARLVMPARPKRLPPGGLRGRVEDHLREHPDQAFGPSQVGKALSRSGGAVANALVKLLDAGTVRRAQDKPLRYTLAPAERSETGIATPTTGTDT